MEDREFLVCGFEGTWYLQYNTAQWLSWLERRPVTAEVESSSLFWVVFLISCDKKTNFIAAAVAELADARDLKSRG